MTGSLDGLAVDVSTLALRDPPRIGARADLR
jgi:hypothetical protein